MRTIGKAQELVLLRNAVAFTDVHRQSAGRPILERELDCVTTLYPEVLLDPLDTDLLAGRISRPLAGLDNVFYPQDDCSDTVGYYYDKHRADALIEAHGLKGSELAAQLEAAADYWKANTSYRAIADAMDHGMRTVLPSRRFSEDSAVCHRLHRVASPSIDYKPLLELGVTGYQQMLRDKAANLSGVDPKSGQFFAAAVGYLEHFKSILSHYGERLADLTARTESIPRRQAYNRMAQAMQALAVRPPESFFEAVQLVHLYTCTGFTANSIGRLDDDLGPFLVRDLESGATTKEEATVLLVNYWQLMCEHYMNGRITLGGKGRRQPQAADVFCELALEATRRFYTEPGIREDRRIWQLSLSPQVAFRQSEETPEALKNQALDVIASGATFPILYNDEANVAAVQNAFRVDATDAEAYTFFDCGEYLIHGRSVGTPSTIINLAKALELTLHDGVDPRTGQRLGPPNPQGVHFGSFEDLWDAYARQMEFSIQQCARFQKLQFDVLAGECGFLAMSLMMADCVEQGRSLLDGGCAMLGGTFETYGNITAADSLYGIKKAVFEDAILPLDELIEHLDNDFKGADDLRDVLLGLPKFGNDEEAVDAMAERVNRHVCELTRRQAAPAGLHHFLVVVINNGANVALGKHVNATADGRRFGKPVSNGHTPTPGRDVSGITALINSILKLSYDQHAGAVHNLRFSKQTFKRHREQVEAILGSYFERGGTQCMITMTSREELLDALEHPEAYGHLLVRVGGYSARFIDLPADIQSEIVNRNAY